DVSNWNVENVTNVNSMFDNASAFNGDVSNWNVINVSDMSYMFNGASSFNGDVSNWNVTNVTHMELMFHGVTLSRANYDALLEGWSTQTLQSNIDFHAGNSTYCATAARDVLTNGPNYWSVIDGGLDANCINPADAFITTWQTTTANESITIPTNPAVSGYNYTVDWGDGTTSTAQTGDASHQYSTAGTFTVSITGDFPAIYFNNIGDKDKIYTIEQWGTQIWEGMDNAFFGCTNLQGNYTDTPNLTAVTDMSNMFRSATAFNGNVNNWNVANVMTMSYMFRNATDFNGDVSNWNVANVTSMYGMFGSASAFNGDLSNWDVSNVILMAYMFRYASAFNGDVSNWDVSNVTSMSAMFEHAIVFNSDLSNWNVANVIEMNNMFDSASAFNGDVSNWNVANVTSMYGMFNSASAFNGDVSNWDVSNVIDMSFMFNGASNFNGDISNWNVSYVTSMFGMFSYASAFNGDVSNWNVANVTDMSYMFYSASVFDSDISNWNVENVTDMTDMFIGVTLSTANYDALLNGWSAQTLQPNVNFHAGNSSYCATAARDILTSAPNNWTITDGGFDANCINPTNTFITTWQTTTANESITIPINPAVSGYNYTVDWGDGTTSTAQTGDATHTYTTAGTYTVSITGDFPAIFFNNFGSKEKITSIEQWGTGNWTTMTRA
ncbi:BspA family leucine-rich repeat surface protein, partial [Aequorivita viscosa]